MVEIHVTSGSLNKDQLSAMQSVFEEGAAKAGENMSMLTGRAITIKVIELADIGVEEACSVFEQDDIPVVMIPIKINSAENHHLGCIVFVMLEDSAKRLNQLLWENICGGDTVLNISDVSAIKEMGNIVGSGYINSLANASGVEMRPTEPVFVYDMIAAIMDALMIEHSMVSDRVLLVKTALETSEQEIGMEFLFLPSPDLAKTLVEKLA